MSSKRGVPAGDSLRSVQPKKNQWVTWVGGLCAGVLNGLLGAGGGILVVPILRKSGLPTKECHATSLAIILPISALSAGIYLFKGSVDIADPLPYMIPGIIGALIGTLCLTKLSNSVIRRLFGLFMLWAAWRMFFG